MNSALTIALVLIGQAALPGCALALMDESAAVEEGRGWGAARLGATRAEVIGAYGPSEDEVKFWQNYRARLGIDVFFGDDPQSGAREIRFNPGFAGRLTSGIGVGSTAEAVFAAYGKPVKTVAVSDIHKDVFGLRVFYRSPNAARIGYWDKGILFWFDSDGRVSQFVVHPIVK